jgi:hypothetical protein
MWLGIRWGIRVDQFEVLEAWCDISARIELGQIEKQTERKKG